MCLIIANPNCEHVPASYIVNAYDTNPHGFGVMYAKNGILKIKRGIMPVSMVNRIFEELEETDTPYVAHFRMATHGTLNASNCHPFAVSGRLNGIGMVHNGVLSGKEWNDEHKSDTALFVNRIQTHLMTGDFEAEDLFKPDVEILSPYHASIGSDKLVFMNGNGEISFYNEWNGAWMEGIWYSNTYSLEPDYADYISLEGGRWMPRKVTATKPLIEPDAEDMFPSLAAMLGE